MFTEHNHATKRLVFEAFDPKRDVEWFRRKIRSDPAVSQWLMPFLHVPWSEAEAQRNLINENALVQ